MKKYSFLVFYKEYHAFLSELQNLGVVHVIEKKSGEIEDDNLREKFFQIQQLSAAIAFLEKRQIEPANETITDDGLNLLATIKGLQAEKEQLLHQLTALRKQQTQLEPWGEFDWGKIETLKNSGISTRFFSCSAKKMEGDWKNSLYIESINQLGGQVYFVLFETGTEKAEIDAEEIILPNRSLSEISKQIGQVEAKLAQTEEQFDLYAASAIGSLKAAKNIISAELSFEKVVLSTQKEADDKLMILEGWVPKDKENELDKYLSINNIYHEVSLPLEDEKVPIKLKNNKFSKLFEPIGKLYMLPTYSEMDLTPYFAPFFMLFFGFCLGDAGYGIFLLLVSLFLRNKVKPELKAFLNLGIFFSISTLLFGILSGTFFGINLIDSGYTLTSDSIGQLASAGVPENIIYSLNSLVGTRFQEQDAYIKAIGKVLNDGAALSMYKSDFIKYASADYSFLQNARSYMLNTNNMMILSLAFGYIQIVFGMFIKTINLIRFKGFKYSVSTIGWIIIVLGGGIVGGLYTLEVLSPSAFKILLYAILISAALPIFLYNAPGKNIFLNIGLGIWDTYGMASGIIGDLLSYIRLFALGLSSAVLGMVFNKLSMSLIEIPVPVLGYVLFLVLLLIGHTLNLFLAALGSFVHPMRLTFVEFYKNAGFTGGGKEYKPFSKLT